MSFGHFQQGTTGRNPFMTAGYPGALGGRFIRWASPCVINAPDGDNEVGPSS